MSRTGDERSGRGRGRAARRRLAAGAGALAVHGLVLLAVLHQWGSAPRTFETRAIEVTLAPPPEPPPPPVLLPPGEPAPAAPAEAPGPKTPEPPKPAKPTPPPPARIVKKLEPSETPPRYVPPEPAPPINEVSVSAADLANATTAESEAAGGGGGAGDGFGTGGGGAGDGAGGRCDMVARLQRKLRNDPSVRAALARARRAPGFEGRPLMIWNGDWVRHGEEEGKGLASLRQAIAVEVAFSPKACRTQTMRGLVLLSLTDSPGVNRVVLGASYWRWSDLLSLR